MKQLEKLPQLDYYALGSGVVAFSSTRHGGCSSGNYASFNINRYCGDSEEHIRRNREQLCRMLAISDDRLIMPHQVHQTRVAQIDEHFLRLDDAGRQEELEGVDAVMTDLCGVCVGVSTADCIPVLLYDADHHAVCAIHAGWRGTVRRIVGRAVEAMTRCYGTRPHRLAAQIGPGIHQDSFEVGDEVYEAFAAEGFAMETISRRYPAADNGSRGATEKWHIDLPACNRQQLMSAGVEAGSIRVSPVCTYQQAADYFSARRLGISSGRIFTGIMLKEKETCHE